MSIPVTEVTSSYVDPSSAPIEGAIVVATLKGNSSSISEAGVQRTLQTRTIEDGSWSLSLIPNSLFGEDSFYDIRVGNKETYEVVVPSSEVPVAVSAILRTTSLTLMPGLFVGDMVLTGSVFVNGDLEVSGDLTATETFEYATLGSGEIPTFPGSFEVVGNLTVVGVVSAKGTITVGI